MKNLSFLVFLLVALFTFVMILRTVVVIAENRRGILFRLGKFVRIMGPGLHILVPFIDTYRQINLNEKIPGWQGLSVDQLDEKVRTILLGEMK